MTKYVDDAQTYTLELISKREVAHQTMEFRFEKPEGFVYKAGQSMRFRMPGTDEERTFSILTAPHEDDLAFAMRIRGSEFKKAIKRFEPGDTISASGPRGKFGLSDDENRPPACAGRQLWVAGGIGITIFLAMLKEMKHRGLTHPVTLLYSNRNQEDIAYKDELDALAGDMPHVRIVYVLTKEKPPHWEGETERINARLIKKYINDVSSADYYVAATPEMVERMHDLFLDMGIPEERIHTKRFKGYEYEVQRF